MCLPRPRGRSGWVITAEISISGWARRWMKVGTAKCGVPQKRRRMGYSGAKLVITRRRSASGFRPCLAGAQRCCAPTGTLHMLLPLALLAELFDFALDQVAL